MFELMKQLNEEERVLRNKNEDLKAFYKKKNEATIDIVKDIVNNPDKYDMRYIDNSRNGGWRYDKVEITIDPESGQKFTILPDVLWNTDITREDFYEFIPGMFRDNEDIVLRAIKETGIDAIEYASEKCKDSEYIAWKSMSYSLYSGENDTRDACQLYFLDRLQDNRKFILDYMHIQGHTLGNAPYALRDDEEVVLAALETDHLNEFAFDSASPRIQNKIQNDKDFVMDAIKQSGNMNILEYTSPKINDELMNDKEFLKDAVMQSGEVDGILRYTTPEIYNAIINDKEAMLEAVKKNSYALCSASPDIKADKEVVMEAVKGSGYELEYASIDLRNDKDVVLEAVKKTPAAIEYASYDMKNDKDIVLEAIKQNKKFIHSAGPELINNIDFIREALIVNKDVQNFIDSTKIDFVKTMTTDFVRNAFENANRIPSGDGTYQDAMIAQRVAGEKNAGSSYKVSANELRQAIFKAKWMETTHPSVAPGCRVFVTKDMPRGKNGIADIRSLPDDTVFYAMDPKGTGNISIGTAMGDNQPVEKKTYLITGKETINGKEEDVVYTFHPGEPVSPSVVSTDTLKEGTKLTKEEALSYGFDKCKFMSDEMVQAYESKQIHVPIEHTAKDNCAEVAANEKIKPEEIDFVAEKACFDSTLNYLNELSKKLDKADEKDRNQKDVDKKPDIDEEYER